MLQTKSNGRDMVFEDRHWRLYPRYNEERATAGRPLIDDANLKLCQSASLEVLRKIGLGIANRLEVSG